MEQLQGTVDYAQTQLDNTVIRAPISGTILERNVEKGEFVTTGFVGDKGAKGYVVSMADLNDLQVELDINQNDFAKLGAKQPGIITTDAYPDRKYKGVIQEISPEANRQKATVQVKVKVLEPGRFPAAGDERHRRFLCRKARGQETTKRRPLITVPATAVRGNVVFLVVDGKAAAPHRHRGRDHLARRSGGERLDRRRRSDLESSAGSERRTAGAAQTRISAMPETVIETSKLHKEYVRDEFHVIALKDVDIQIAEGRVCGADGSFRIGQIDAAALDRGDGPAQRRRDPGAGREPAGA